MRVVHEKRCEELDWAQKPDSETYLLVLFEPGTAADTAQDTLQTVLEAPPSGKGAEIAPDTEPPTQTTVLGNGTVESGHTALAVGFPQPTFKLGEKELSPEQTARLCRNAVDASFPSKTEHTDIFKDDMETEMQFRMYALYTVGAVHTAPDDNSEDPRKYWLTDFGVELNEKNLTDVYLSSMPYLCQEGDGEFTVERVEP
jgi:hypothetical protein